MKFLPVPPPALKPGDLVAVCAPCGPVPEGPLARGLALLEKRYVVRCDPHLHRRKHHYLAGTDEQRAGEFHSALSDPEVRAIFCARGGYGAMRLLQLLDPELLRSDPKPICGFSDVTVLLHWSLKAKVVPIHGPVVTQLGQLDRNSLEHCFRLMEDPTYRPVYKGKNFRKSPDPKKPVVGQIWGGNLAVLAGLSGTGWLEPETPTILAIEEVAEPPYRLDRMVTQLLLSGCLENVRAVASGDLLARPPDPDDASPPENDPALVEGLDRRLGELGLEALFNLPWGHGHRFHAFPMGVEAELDPTAGTLRLLAGGVAGR